MAVDRNSGKRVRCFIGIDPGTRTGFAVKVDGFKMKVETTDFFGAIERIQFYRKRFECLEVRIEDPSQNKPVWFDHRKATVKVSEARSKLKIAQNVGENKKEAKLLIEFCKRLNIKVIPVRPKRGSMTKVSPELFRKVTGYGGRTSEHGRDAGMLIAGI